MTSLATKKCRNRSLDFWSEPSLVAVVAGKHIEGDVYVVPSTSICDEFGHKEGSKPESLDDLG